MIDDLAEGRRVLEAEAQSILAAMKRLDKTFVQALDLIEASIHNKGKIIVTGVGKSGKVASKIAATLSSTGTPAIFLHPTEGLHGDLGVVFPSDLFFVFSYSGNSAEIMQLLPSLKNKGVKVVSVLGNVKSPIAALSDVVVDGSVAREACPLNLAPTSSTTVAMALGDALAMAISVRLGFKEEQFAENHPGGALGRRLTFFVRDLMKKNQDIAWIDQNSSAMEAVQSITAKKLGAVLVRDAQKKLTGIITDGDIRRALAKGPDFFNSTAAQIMTAKPITIHMDEKAIQALELMENRPSQISVLPVMNAQGECVGLVRVHDLIGTV